MFRQEEKRKSKYKPETVKEFEISKSSENFIFVLDDDVRKIEFSFKINDLKNIEYQVDKSIFIHVKDDEIERMKICGKLKILLSPDPI